MSAPPSGFQGYVTVQGRGTVALPPVIRKRYHLDRKGAQVEITEREDGVLALRPAVAVPGTRAWFWEERWQVGEREVDQHVRRGEITVSQDVEEFLADLSGLDQE